MRPPHLGSRCETPAFRLLLQKSKLCRIGLGISWDLQNLRGLRFPHVVYQLLRWLHEQYLRSGTPVYYIAFKLHGVRFNRGNSFLWLHVCNVVQCLQHGVLSTSFRIIYLRSSVRATCNVHKVQFSVGPVSPKRATSPVTDGEFTGVHVLVAGALAGIL